jgi:hypothetical protein
LPEPSFRRTPGLLGPIFEESGRAERAMREALFLTFNVDLGFFEDRLLGPVRSTGAAVTVIVDATVFNPDPRNVRSAGRAYALGLAHHAAAFHPKLTIVAGPDRALIGIGSGNLTIGGWHANDEVLTTIRGNREAGTPRIVADIAAFLRRLPHAIRISPLGVDGVERTATQLESLINNSQPIDTGHRLVHSLDAPILNQLPVGPATALELAAPFHDEHGSALAQLVHRYQPEQITLLAQPGQAVMKPSALTHQAGTTALQFVHLAGEPATSTRYRHGKIATALRESTVHWTLTGSPNLTGAALLRTAAGPPPIGNCELGIVTTGGPTLMPTPVVAATDLPSLEHLIPVSAASDEEPVPLAVRITEARNTDQGLLVVLTRTADDDTCIEVSHYLAPPDVFEPIGTVSAGHSQATFPGTFEAGTRVRTGKHIQFVADPQQIQYRLRPATGGGVNRDVGPAQLFTSQILADQWQRALTDLLLSHERATAGQQPTATNHAPHDHKPGAWHTLADASTWTDYADAARNALGMPIFLLAAGSAASSAIVGAGLPSAALAWEDRFDDTADSFEDDQTAENLDATRDDNPPTTTMTANQRAYYRNWFARLTELMPRTGPIERLALTQLVIAGTGAQCWDSDTGQRGWFTTLANALDTLIRDDWPERLTAQAAAIFAIGTYRLRLATPPDDRGSDAARVHALATRGADLIATASAASLEPNLALLDGVSVLPPNPRDVLDEVQQLAVAQLDQALIRRLERTLPDLDAKWVGRAQLQVSGKTTNPVQTAARILNLADGFDTLAVSVTSHKQTWVVLVMTPDRLTIIDGRKPQLLFTTYQLSGVNSPLTIVTNPERLQRTRISKPPFNRPGPAELDVLAHVDLSQLAPSAEVRRLMFPATEDSPPT